MSAMTLWQSFTAGDPAAREALLAEHISLVHHVSRQIHRRVSSDVELDELVSAGTMGLIEALERFDAVARPRLQHLRGSARSRRDSRRAASHRSRSLVDAPSHPHAFAPRASRSATSSAASR